MGKTARAVCDAPSLDECRASIKKMSAHMLLGQRNQFNSNVRDGTMPLNFGMALIEAFKERESELALHKAEVARRPYVAFLMNTEKRRKEERELEDCEVELQPTGKGGVRRYLVSKANVKAAAQRAED